MGSGRWSTDVYDAAARFRAATGASAFAYSDSGAARVHDTLDPLGVPVRESRDSAEHPESLAIAVLFDVTGSMRDVPRTLQLADTGAVCETIALTVGLGEDAISLDDGLADLGDVGSAAGPTVSKALAVIGAGRAALEVAVAPDDLGGPSGNVRL